MAQTSTAGFTNSSQKQLSSESTAEERMNQTAQSFSSQSTSRVSGAQIRNLTSAADARREAIRERVKQQQLELEQQQKEAANQAAAEQ